MADTIILSSLSRLVAPGDCVIANGWNFDANCYASIVRYADKSPTGLSEDDDEPVEASAAYLVPPVQVTVSTLKFMIPSNMSPGLYKIFIQNQSNKRRSAMMVANRPEPQWMQNITVRQDASQNDTVIAAPGDVLRICGVGFYVAKAFRKNVRVRFVSEGMKAQVLALDDSLKGEYALTVRVPASLASGKWAVSVHNGFGGPDNWATVPEVLQVTGPPAAWPKTVFNVSTMGLAGAIKAAANNGGGIVYLPSGRYSFQSPLELPPFTVMRGDGSTSTSITWTFTDTSGASPPSAMIRGSIFGVEDLAIYSIGPFYNCIETDTAASFTSIRNVIFRANPYMITYIGSAESKAHLAMGAFAYLRGRNIEISGCDIYAPNLIFVLDGSSNAFIARNHFAFGGQGFVANAGDRVVIEHNTILGNTFTSAGDVLKSEHVITRSKVQERMFYGYNNHSLILGEARQPLAHVGVGCFYYGKVASSDKNNVVLAANPAPLPKDLGGTWNGTTLVIVAGRGRGQVARIVSYSGRNFTLDAPLEAGTDSSSVAVITFYRGRNLIIGNSFSDCGPVTLGGAAFNSVFARNTLARSEGFRVISETFGSSAWMPSSNIEVVDNTITEGNCWGSVAATFGLHGEGSSPQPMTSFCTMKRNIIRNNAYFLVAGNVTDSVIEANTVNNSACAVDSSGVTLGDVVLANNKLINVETPVTGPGNKKFTIIGNVVSVLETDADMTSEEPASGAHRAAPSRDI